MHPKNDMAPEIRDVLCCYGIGLAYCVMGVCPCWRVVAGASKPSERLYAAESLYSTSAGGHDWASAFCVNNISNRELTSDIRALPPSPLFSGVLPNVEKEVESSGQATGQWASGDGGPSGTNRFSW